MSERAHPTAEERAARGKAARAAAPRSAHGEWSPHPDRPAPVGVLERQAETRVPELVPIRYGRMLASPFAFFRGAAAIMAADLADTPTSGLEVQLCGDAHLSNFGIFAAPDRALVFDVNDFDETHAGPWEWDVKRLAASLAVAGRERGLDERMRRSIVAGAVAEYRTAMAGFAAMRNIDVWYSRLDVEALLDRWGPQASRQQVKKVRRNLAKARTKDSLRAFDRLTETVDGEPRIVSDPPLIVPVEDLVAEDGARDLTAWLGDLLGDYESSLPDDRRRLLRSYRHVHLARKVVGVGSVGTRAWIILMLGRDEQDPLFLQAKEAPPSVLESHVGGAHEHNGRRVVEGQRVMQAASDVFLGWLHATGIDGRERDFYLRQLWDCKRSAEIELMEPQAIALYARMCGWTLARAHARSGDRIAIAAYLGSGQAFDRALCDFAEAYADRNERDHAALAAAVAAGSVEAQTGL